MKRSEVEILDHLVAKYSSLTSDDVLLPKHNVKTLVDENMPYVEDMFGRLHDVHRAVAGKACIGFSAAPGCNTIAVVGWSMYFQRCCG